MTKKYKRLKHKLDVDYKHKLSEEERAWLKQFEDEYYYRRKGDLLPDEMVRIAKTEKTDSEADVLTASDAKVSESLSKTRNNKSNYSNLEYGSPDYRNYRNSQGRLFEVDSSNSPEDAIIEWIDSQKDTDNES